MPDSLRLDADGTDRRAWMGLLARATRAELEAGWRLFDPTPIYRMLRPPETGLALVRGRIGGSGDAFNLGEMTMTRCAVRLDPPGTSVGMAFIAGRDARCAELAAVFDALLQEGNWSAAIDRTVLQPVTQRIAERRRERAAQVAATKVEFFTMVRERENA